MDIAGIGQQTVRCSVLTRTNTQQLDAVHTFGCFVDKCDLPFCVRQDDPLLELLKNGLPLGRIALNEEPSFDLLGDIGPQVQDASTLPELPMIGW